MQTTDTTRPLLDPTEPIPADLWAILGAAPHPVLLLPDEAYLRSVPLAELLADLHDRAETIRRMEADPAAYGYEPPLWRLLDALCGFPWLDHAEDAILAEPSATARERMRAEQAWCLLVRRTLLGRDEPVKILLINGGNRAGKSEWAASRVLKLLRHRRASRAWALHQNAQMSRDYQQKTLYRYLPAALKTEKGIRKSTTYIAYKAQTGFPDEKFTLPNASDCVFKYYEQDIRSIEGGELDLIWCDELVPASWIETLKARVATRAGWLLITFTPVTGYTPTIARFLSTAQITREAIAYLLPTDGGPQLPDLALAGETPEAWPTSAPSQPPPPPGREFERVPRLARCSEPATAVAWFHSFDNPFGGPRELLALYGHSTPDVRRMRFYGIATKAASTQFPRFGELLPGSTRPIHIVPATAIPTRGTRYMVVDPCSGRNFAMIWALVDTAPIGTRVWIYREWPCPGKYVPGEGDLGDWAEPGDKLDGHRGPAQRPLGWGLLRYRQEIARLEGRADWKTAQPEDTPTPFRWDSEDTYEHTPPPRRPRATAPGEAPAPEDIYERIIDSRYAATPTQTREGQTTLLEELDKIGLHFRAASGRDIADGTVLINNHLFWRSDQPHGPLNEPRLYISEECRNTIFALRTWTEADGQHGACKDFIDLLRYLLLAEPEDYQSTTKAA